jgi:hypothetical protein
MMVISYLTGHRHLEDLMAAVTEAAKKTSGSAVLRPANKP